MFRPRYRRSTFDDPLNWTDYRWETGRPWHRATAAPRAFRHRRESPLLLLLFAGLAAMLVAKLFSSLQSRNGSWARRATFGVIVLLIVGAFSRRRRHW